MRNHHNSAASVKFIEVLNNSSLVFSIKSICGFI